MVNNRVCEYTISLMTKIRSNTSEYFRLHEKLVRINGNASQCSNPNCTYKNPKRYEWAIIKGREYSLDINDYMQLCPSCHRKYDFNPESAKRAGLKQRGIPKEHRMRYVMRLSTDDHYTYLDISKAAKENNISRTGILNCLSGLSKTAGGYKWMYRL